jgi:non-reducing end alpha-L-arabinofuranosidase
MRNKSRFLIITLLAFILPVAILTGILLTGCGSTQRPEGPCDIYTESGFPCVTAHSSTRALYASYNGPLYQVMRDSDGKTLDIGVVGPGKGSRGGYADAAAQDEFCANTLCWITIVYDQSGNNNHLVQAPPGTFRGPAKGGFNTLPIADMAPVTIMGNKVYGVFVMPGAGLRDNNASGLAINDEPEGIYMVVDGTHFDHGCCFNYGNTSTNSRAVGRGTMETVYFGTSTAWGKGAGPGPWIMSDMEAGLFSGYNAKQNDGSPTIDSWRFVTGMVNGGGGNQWQIHGGNAQEGDLTTFYDGIRPHSNDNDWYNPMHRKGAVQMGNGGDNGNGSSGTFYEGVMTTGYPDIKTLKAVQKNIVAAKYDVAGVSLSRVTSFTPGSDQNVTVTFTNMTGTKVTDVTLSISSPEGWTAVESGSGNSTGKIAGPIAPGKSVTATFKVTSPKTSGAGYLSAKAEWKNKSETTSQRIRNVLPVKINEVLLSSGSSSSDQFIELYNSSDNEIDISGWTLINTRSEWAPVKLATIPAGTMISAKGFYLLGLAGSGLASPASQGANNINVLSSTDFKAGQRIEIGGEIHTIAKTGTAAAPMAAVFVPVSTGPWLTIPAGSTNLPVTSASGFEPGQKIGIDLGGNYEEATVTFVGKESTLTTLSEEAKAGDTVIKVAGNTNMTIGDSLTIGTGSRREVVSIKEIISIAVTPVRGGFEQGSAGRYGEVELTSPLKFYHMLAEDVSDKGTGISFTPATRFEHRSGDAVQALGSGLILTGKLNGNHEAGTAVLNRLVKTTGYQGSVTPDQWYGAPLSSAAGSLALYDNSGLVIVDAIVYGSAQTNSGANGTITSPEIATLEGIQRQSGCIVVVPGVGRNIRPTGPSPDKSVGRYPDGTDTDNNCTDFFTQGTTTIAAASQSGSKNIKVTSVADFIAGQKIIVGSGLNSEPAVIAEIGTAGGTITGTATTAGATVILVSGLEGFNAGQTITIGNPSSSETAVISSTAAVRRRFVAGADVPLDTIKITAPLKNTYDVGSQVSGSGITLSTPLTRSHARGEQLAGSIPTPGKPNEYIRKQL